MGWDSKLTTLFLLNLFDGVLTLYALSYGVAEANPIMAQALVYGPVGFLLIKVGLVTTCLIFLDKFLIGRQRRLLTILVVIYAAVTVWHIFGVITLYNLLPSPQSSGIFLERGHESLSCLLSAFYYS